MPTSREKILAQLKNISASPSDLAPDGADAHEIIQQKLQEITPQNREGLLQQFKKELELVSGECHLAADWDEMVSFVANMLDDLNPSSVAIAGNAEIFRLKEKLQQQNDAITFVAAQSLDGASRKHELAQIPFAIATANFAIADTGTIAVCYDDVKSSLPFFLADVVFVLIHEGDVVANQFELIQRIDRNKAKNMVFITGPSRTADIEKVLVLGAHGPHRLVVGVLKA
jgi:L-lactate dehydrogenase complex protein LldG